MAAVEWGCCIAVIGVLVVSMGVVKVAGLVD